MTNVGQPWEATPVAAMRASHADRERAVDVLKAAYSEGRLNQAEYEQRIELAYRASTYGELGRLVGDLPAGPIPMPAYPHPSQLAVPHSFLPAPPPAPPVNGLATASLVCGLGGLVFGVPAIPAIVLGHTARARIRASGGSGEQAAVAGLALGWVVVGLWAVVWLVVGLV